VASDRQGNFGFLIISLIISKTSILAAATTRDNFDEFKIGRAA
jgi:hypothetical protein